MWDESLVKYRKTISNRKPSRGNPSFIRSIFKNLKYIKSFFYRKQINIQWLQYARLQTNYSQAGVLWKYVYNIITFSPLSWQRRCLFINSSVIKPRSIMFYFTTKKHAMPVLDFSIEFMKKSNKYNSWIHLLKTFTLWKSFDQKNSYEIIAFGNLIKQQSHWFIKIRKPIILKEKSYSEKYSKYVSMETKEN